MAPNELMTLNAGNGSSGGFMEYCHFGLAVVCSVLLVFTQLAYLFLV